MQQKKVKILVEGTRARYEKFLPQDAPLDRVELAFCGRGSSNAELLAAGGDAQILCVDAISPVDAALIAKMPNLRLIHSEGVAFNCIDLAAAKKRGIYVCNCKGCNADAVAEQTVMLILELLRHGLTGDAAVRAGRQMEMKERLMVEGITELGECSVGLIGFGDIAKAAAARLHPFGCELFYYAPHRKDPETELEYHVAYLELEELAARCDIVIAVGGDGTIIHTAKHASRAEKPILGVNLGRLGFLAGVERDELYLLRRLFSGDYTVRRRMMLEITVHGDEGERT